MDVVFNSGKSGSYLIMNNDSGYVSNNLDQESNSDSVTESLNNSSVEILKSLLPKSIYISEDALLERPDLDKTVDAPAENENYTELACLNYEDLSTNIFVNSINNDQRTAPKFNSFQSDSGSSACSVIIPIAEPIYYDLNNKTESVSSLLNEEDNISSNPSDGPFFGYENVPMQRSNQVFKNGFNNSTNEFMSTDEKINSFFLGFIANKQRPVSIKDSVVLEQSGPAAEETKLNKAEDNGESVVGRTTSVVEQSDVILEKALYVIGPSDSELQESEVRETALAGSEETISLIESTLPTSITVNAQDSIEKSSIPITEVSFNIEDLPVFIGENPILMKNASLIAESPLEEQPNGNTVDSTLENRNAEIYLSPSLTNSCDKNDEMMKIEEIPNKTEATSNELSRNMENKILTNSNKSVCDLNQAGPSKIVKPPRRNSMKNKENSREPEVFKTPSKCLKRKFSEVGSPDLFSDDESSKAKPLPSPKIMEERFVHKLDQRLIKRVQRTISGVPPPPDMTITKLTLDDILKKLEANKDLFWTRENLEEAKKKSDEKEKASLNGSHNSSFGCPSSILIEGNHEEAINKEFPDILYSRHHGLHYNRSKMSEEIEHLCDKYGKRYIGAETQSTCNAVETQYLSPSKRKGVKPMWAVKSPGRRLSHLAKRRITFSSASLQASSSSSAASRARQILIDYKKLELLNRKNSPKKSPRKTPMKSPASPMNGRTPSSSAKKKLRMRFRLLSGDFKELMAGPGSSNISASKRALFQSPDKDSKFSRNILNNSTSALNSSFERDLASRGTRRSLFSSPNKARTSLFPSPSKRSPFKSQPTFEKKRKREDEDENVANQPKFFRSQSSYGFADRAPKADGSLTRTKSESVLLNSQTMSDMSAANKKKLQWAVYESLKLQNVTTAHPQFKVFASVLARVTRRIIVSSSIKLEGSGTSEKMLRIARRHSYAVVKGKSVEEIMSEFNKAKAKNLKPQGYVAPQDYNPFSRESALKDRDSNSGDSVTKSSAPTVQKPESRIDRIRKVINFEDNR